jgi:hypothetical protein
MIYLGLREIGAVAVLALAFAGCGTNASDDDDDDDRGEAGEGAGPGASGAPGSGGSSAGTSGSDGSGGTGNASSGGSSAAGKGGGGSGSGTGGSASGNTDELLDIIEAHCEADCDAQYALDCAPVNSNRLVCETSCVSATAQVGDFCLVEYAALVECRSQGGYECLQDYPYSRSTCAGESLAFSECARDIGCKRYCDRLVDEQCGDASFDDCLTQCFEEEAALPVDCQPYYDGVPYCQATMATATCVDGKLSTPEACSYSVMSVAECIGEDATNYCDGFCWAADRLGCGGEDCAADCAAKSADETCGAAWLDMLDCAMFFGDAACVDGVFMGNSICDSEAQAYATCVAPPVEP